MAFNSPGRRLRFTNLRSKFRLPTTDNLTTYGKWRNLFIAGYPTDPLVAERVVVRTLRKTTDLYIVTHPEVNSSNVDFGSNITGNRGVVASVNPSDESNITLFALDQITSIIPPTGTIVPNYKIWGSINIYNYDTSTNTLSNITPTNHWLGSQPVYNPANVSPLVVADEELVKATGIFAPTPMQSANLVTFINDDTGTGVFRRAFTYDYANSIVYTSNDGEYPGIYNNVQRQFFDGPIYIEDARNWDYTSNVAITISDFNGSAPAFTKFAYNEAPYAGYAAENGRHILQDFRTRDIYLVPGVGCSKNSQIDPANVDTTRRIIAKANISANVVTELNFESGGYTMAPAGATDVDRATEEWFRGAIQGADANLYCFRANTSADANITVLNPDTETLEISSKFGIYNTNGSNTITWKPNPIICGDGYIRVFAEGTQGAITGNMMLSIDTNPESPTYQTGRLDDIIHYPETSSTEFVGYVMDGDKNIYAYTTRNDGTITNANVSLKKYTIGANAGISIKNVFYSGPLRIRNPIIA